MSTHRFNLRNASLYLNKIRTKYQENRNQQQNAQNKTFIDEQDQLQSNPSSSQNKIKNNDSQQNIFSTSKRDIQTFKQKNVIIEEPCQNQMVIALKKTQTTIQAEFCDLIVIKYLQQTLDIYKNDLDILQLNRQNLQQQIHFIAKKISKLPETTLQNTRLQKDLQQLNQELLNTIQKYHQSNKNHYKIKLRSQRLFKTYTNRLKYFLLIDNNSCNDLDFIKTDSTNTSYLQAYAEYFSQKKFRFSKISEHIQNQIKNPEQVKKQKQKMIKQLFQGKDKIYLNRTQVKSSQVNKNTIAPFDGNKCQDKSKLPRVKDILLYQQQQSDQQKPQKQFMLNQKSKKLSAAQKDLLLGDLKNFSKSFKLPSK